MKKKSLIFHLFHLSLKGGLFPTKTTSFSLFCISKHTFHSSYPLFSPIKTDSNPVSQSVTNICCFYHILFASFCLPLQSVVMLSCLSYAKRLERSSCCWFCFSSSSFSSSSLFQDRIYNWDFHFVFILLLFDI